MFSRGEEGGGFSDQLGVSDNHTATGDGAGRGGGPAGQDRVLTLDTGRQLAAG